VEEVLRPQSKPSAAKSVGALNEFCQGPLSREEREPPRVRRKTLRPSPGLHPYTPSTGWGSTPVRGQPHTSIKERIREPPPLAQKSWRSFCDEGLYASWMAY
jgi:hypothetical protein